MESFKTYSLAHITGSCDGIIRACKSVREEKVDRSTAPACRRRCPDKRDQELYEKSKKVNGLHVVPHRMLRPRLCRRTNRQPNGQKRGRKQGREHPLLNSCRCKALFSIYRFGYSYTTQVWFCDEVTVILVGHDPPDTDGGWKKEGGQGNLNVLQSLVMTTAYLSYKIYSLLLILCGAIIIPASFTNSRSVYANASKDATLLHHRHRYGLITRNQVSYPKSKKLFGWRGSGGTTQSLPLVPP